MTKKAILILFLLLITIYSFAQMKVAVTIDDVPNTRKFEKDKFEPVFLHKLDSLKIPVTVFINEGQIYKTQKVSRNFRLLNVWVKREYVTPGNHTFGHSRYSDAGMDIFLADVIKGQSITEELAKLYEKPLKYFRFPYNDLGSDSAQQEEIKLQLAKLNYTIAPFTIESSDWMFNYVYEYYKNEGDDDNARKIGEKYVETTLEYFEFFDSLSVSVYNRHINQIYLCHDNSINADYLEYIIDELKKREYTFISLDEALEDEIYQQENKYYKKWGISWFYRYLADKEDINKLMELEPDIMPVYEEYQRLVKLNSK